MRCQPGYQQGHGLLALLDGSIAAVDTGEIAQRPVAAEKERRAGQPGLQGDQTVEAVDTQRPPRQLRAVQATTGAHEAGGLATGGTLDGLALARRQLVVIADQ